MSIRIIPLGGLGEVGKNMTVFESGEDAIVVDAGLAFPRDEHLGVDLVLPEMTYLAERRNGVRALLLTHGHEDHVGALPYLLRVAQVREIWATRLTLGLIKSKLDEHGLLRAAELREAEIGKPVELGALPRRVRPHGALDPRLGGARDPGRGEADRPHGRLQARPHADRRPEHRRRPARRARKPGRRPDARRLDERRAAGRDAVRARRRRGVPADLPAAHGTHPRLVVRVERPPRAAGDRRRRRPRPQGGGRRPLDAQEREHRAEPRLHGRSRRHPAQAGGPAGAAARRAADHLHGQPGRADVGAHADRLQRPSGSQCRARRHRDHLREAGAGERAARPRRDQPARAVGRGGVAPGDRSGARVGPRQRGGAAYDPRAAPAEGGDARARRVPDARRARAARARRGRARVGDRDGRERHRRRAHRHRRRASSTRSRPA